VGGIIQRKQLQSFTEQTTLSLRGLPSGMYLIQLQTEQGSVSKKLVKE
jgi:hypothetical protein